MEYIYIDYGYYYIMSYFVAVNNPTIQISKLTLGTLYVGLTFPLRCDAEIPGSQVAGVSAEIEWRGPGGSVLTSDSRVTVGSVEEETAGREYRRLLTFSPLSAMDTGSYSCSATVRPTVANSNVMNGVGSGGNSLTVARKFIYNTIVGYLDTSMFIYASSHNCLCLCSTYLCTLSTS